MGLKSASVMGLCHVFQMSRVNKHIRGLLSVALFFFNQYSSAHNMSEMQPKPFSNKSLHVIVKIENYYFRHNVQHPFPISLFFCHQSQPSEFCD